MHHCLVQRQVVGGKRVVEEYSVAQVDAGGVGCNGGQSQLCRVIMNVVADLGRSNGQNLTVAVLGSRCVDFPGKLG